MVLNHRDTGRGGLLCPMWPVFVTEIKLNKGFTYSITYKGDEIIKKK